MICGVDEAGKGSVLGPMVVAAVGAQSADVFSDLGVKDSKDLTQKERERLFSLIKKRCRIAMVVIPAEEIDAIRREMTMNACVARAHAQVIEKLAPATAYIDACDVNPFRYAQTVRSHLTVPCELVSEHHADSTYPVVSAASIVAKVTRDREITKISKKFGEIGSGYPSDPITISYLSTYIDEHRAPPPIARKSWKTVIVMLAKKSQSSLSAFL
ncbi:MAG: ribonuclease HII [Methanoregula sp.]|uniref:ribonuclease HII n=1 Tax=Methanoregula sp. TaxID=2052170 RepID=UPI003C329188